MTTEDQETSRTASTKPSYSIMHRPGYPHYPVPPSGHFGQYSQHHLLQPTASAGLDNGGIFLSNWLNHWLRFWFLRPWKFPLLGAKNASFCVKRYCTEGAFNNFKFHLSLTNYLSGQLWTFYIITSPSVHLSKRGVSTDHLPTSSCPCSYGMS